MDSCRHYIIGGLSIQFTPPHFFFFNFISPSPVCPRLDDITQRVDWLEQQTPVALIRAVGDSYRAHYRHKCRGVNWMHKLHTLQLIAVCLGKDGTVLHASASYLIPSSISYIVRNQLLFSYRIYSPITTKCLTLNDYVARAVRE
jgi:hypothetical protein